MELVRFLKFIGSVTNAAIFRVSFVWLKSMALVSFLIFGSDAFAQGRSKPSSGKTLSQKSRSKAVNSDQNRQKNLKVAKAFYDAGRYSEAIRVAAREVKRNPKNIAALVLVAQSYYYLGDVRKSAKIFNAIKLDDLPSRAAVEYALAMFAAKKYEKSAQAWKKVPPDHPYVDVVKFYSGASYLNLREYSRAVRLLRSAKKIPSSLVSERRRLLDVADAAIDRSRRGLFAKEQSYAYQAQPSYSPEVIAPPYIPPPPSPGGRVAPPPATAPTKAAPPPKPQVGWSISATPGFSYESANEKVDFNGYNLAVSESRTPAVSLPIGVKYTGSPRSFGVQPYFSLNLTPGYSDTEAKSSTSSLFASEEDPTAIQSVVASSESHTYKQTYLGLVEAMYPLSDPIDVTLSYVNDQTYVQASPKLARIFSGPKGKITIEVDKVKFDGIVSVINEENKALALLDADTKVKTDQTLQGIVSVTGDDSLTKLDVSSIQTESVSEKGTKSVMLGKANWDKPIADFNLGIGLNYASRTPYEDSLLTLVQSAGSERGVSANLGWSGFFGISITGGFSYTLLDKLDYLSKSEDKTELISSNGDSISYSLIGSIPIFGAFGGLDLSYRYTDRKIDPPGELDPETQIAILKNFWSQTTSTSVKLSVRFPL